VTGTGGTG